MNVEEITVTPPLREGVLSKTETIHIWPLVQDALALLEADEVTRDAALRAVQCSDGCVTLANFLRTEAERTANVDPGFKVPLLVLAAEMAREDDRADSIYDPDEGTIYFETDSDQFAFPVVKDFAIDWTAVADEVIKGYEPNAAEQDIWALASLLSFLELDLDPYRGAAEE